MFASPNLLYFPVQVPPANQPPDEVQFEQPPPSTSTSIPSTVNIESLISIPESQPKHHIQHSSPEAAKRVRTEPGSHSSSLNTAAANSPNYSLAAEIKDVGLECLICRAIDRKKLSHTLQ
jgi:hypothetical protein